MSRIDVQVFLPATDQPTDLEGYADHMLAKFTEEHLSGQVDPGLPSAWTYDPGSGSRGHTTDISRRGST